MDWPNNYVYIPVWLLALLVFLASGAVQYALVAAVRWVIREAERPAKIRRENQEKIRRLFRPGKD